jgi:hypothetical protein
MVWRVGAVRRYSICRWRGVEVGFVSELGERLDVVGTGSGEVVWKEGRGEGARDELAEEKSEFLRGRASVNRLVVILLW